MPKNFTELDRLAYVVRSIDNDCTLTPVGALKLTPTHEIRYNDRLAILFSFQSALLYNFLYIHINILNQNKTLSFYFILFYFKCIAM